MSSTKRMDPLRSEQGEPRAGVVRRRPLTVFVVAVLAVGSLVYGVPAVTGLPVEPFHLVVTFVVLLGSALLVSRLADGPGAARRMLSRVMIWRFGVSRWLVILFGMPVLTYAVAAATGTMSGPESGWLAVTGLYLFNTLVYGALILNLWEEAAWGGFLQSRLMARHGLLVGSVITGLPFAGLHIPVYLMAGGTVSEIATGLAILFALVPFYRYLIGMHLLDTRGSILAIGIQHASWNAVVGIEGVDGDWQVWVAVILLTVLVAVGRRLRPAAGRPLGTEAEKAAAGSWIAARPSERRP